MKYFSIKSVSNAFAKGVKETMKTVFARSGISNSTSSLLGLNVDGSSVNMGVHRGLDLDKTRGSMARLCPLF